MKRRTYLTIDDSPSARTDDLIDALAARNVPAILFCRGDLMDINPGPVIRAIQKGFIIGNHGYMHKRASTLGGYEAVCENILKCDAVIERCYHEAGVTRPAKYYRFAYMDRGMGPWFVEPDSVPAEYRDYVSDMIKIGLSNDPTQLPTADGIALKNRLQGFLKDQGYVPVPYNGVNLPFYTNSEMVRAIDAMYTYSTSDWSLNERHRGKFGFSTIDDLKTAIDNDPYLKSIESAHIILIHDHDEIHDVSLALVDYLLAKGFTFGGYNE